MKYILVVDYPYHTIKHFFEEQPENYEPLQFIDFQSNRILQQRLYELESYKEVEKDGKITKNYKIGVTEDDKLKLLWIK